LVLGVGAAGVGAFFDGLRPYMLVLVGILLLVLFRRAFGSQAACADEESCATDAARKGARRNFLMATAVAIVLASYPYWSSALQGGSGPRAGGAAFAEASAQGRLLEVRISGMTCEACAATARSAIIAVSGVEDASVDAESGRASIIVQPKRKPDVVQAAVADALAPHGYALVSQPGGKTR